MYITGCPAAKRAASKGEILQEKRKRKKNPLKPYR
jgi:hypothetical protein